MHFIVQNRKLPGEDADLGEAFGAAPSPLGPPGADFSRLAPASTHSRTPCSGDFTCMLTSGHALSNQGWEAVKKTRNGHC